MKIPEFMLHNICKYKPLLVLLPFFRISGNWEKKNIFSLNSYFYFTVIISKF